jgi:hypothetical protein
MFRAMKTAPVLSRRPEARAETVEELVSKVLRGLVRVPSFQRGLKWKAKDVIDLLDSVYRGYPIGSLLLWQRPAEATRITLGPLMVDAPETSSASWVVDGQQRLVAFAASLARPEPIPRKPVDPYVVYFDAKDEQFYLPPSNGEIPTTWVPAPLLLDASRLSEWVLDWPHSREVLLRQALFEAGKRLREYPVPFYVVDATDESLLKEIFYRINNSGQKLDWSEIHDALFSKAGKTPSTLEGLADALSELGMGRVENDTLLQCLLAVRGLDVTQNLSEHRRRDQDVLKNAVREALPPLRRVLSFLRESAEIPHVRLLPRALPLVVLTRFFTLHAEPNRRTRELLTRWVWRLFMTVGTFDERTMLRRGVRVIEPGEEEKSTQELLKLIPKRSETSFTMPTVFDPRAAASRVVLVALTTLAPKNLVTGERLDVATIIESEEAHAFHALAPTKSQGSAITRTSANRIIHPKEPVLLRRLLERIREAHPHDEVLASHAISLKAARSLDKGDVEEFLTIRSREMTRLVNNMGERLAAWARNDRPSINHLLNEGETQP